MTRPDLDAVFTLLANPRRRLLLSHFLESDYGNVETLSRHIAAREQDAHPRAVSEDDRTEVAVSLVHDHLPRLADHDVVDYDARSGDVVTAAGFGEVQPFVEQVYPATDATATPERSLLSFLYSKPPEEPYLLEDD